METMDSDASLLSNYEVCAFLSEERASRPPHVHVPQNVKTIEFEVSTMRTHPRKTLEYFSKVLSCVTTALTEESLGDLLEFLSRFALTKAERLQLVNMLPKTVVEFYLVRYTCNAA